MATLVLTDSPIAEHRTTPKIWMGLRAMLEIRVVQLGALAVLLAGIGAIAMHLKFSVLDVDLWWHLKVGDWILEHAAVPHTGILSRSAANRPWVAYSWGYEVLLSRAYAWFGLIGIGVFGTLLTIAVAYAAYYMLFRLSGRFWIASVGPHLFGFPVQRNASAVLLFHHSVRSHHDSVAGGQPHWPDPNSLLAASHFFAMGETSHPIYLWTVSRRIVVRRVHRV